MPELTESEPSRFKLWGYLTTSKLSSSRGESKHGSYLAHPYHDPRDAYHACFNLFSNARHDARGRVESEQVCAAHIVDRIRVPKLGS
jgi:hypothetical protein